MSTSNPPTPDEVLFALRRMLRIGRRMEALFPPLGSPRWSKGDPAMIPVAQLRHWLTAYEPQFNPPEVEDVGPQVPVH